MTLSIDFNMEHKVAYNIESPIYLYLKFVIFDKERMITPD
jgi:hypothetical protein